MQPGRASVQWRNQVPLAPSGPRCPIPREGRPYFGFSGVGVAGAGRAKGFGAKRFRARLTGLLHKGTASSEEEAGGVN